MALTDIQPADSVKALVTTPAGPISKEDAVDVYKMYHGYQYPSMVYYGQGPLHYFTHHYEPVQDVRGYIVNKAKRAVAIKTQTVDTVKASVVGKLTGWLVRRAMNAVRDQLREPEDLQEYLWVVIGNETSISAGEGVVLIDLDGTKPFSLPEIPTDHHSRRKR